MHVSKHSMGQRLKFRRGNQTPSNTTARITSFTVRWQTGRALRPVASSCTHAPPRGRAVELVPGGCIARTRPVLALGKACALQTAGAYTWQSTRAAELVPRGLRLKAHAHRSSSMSMAAVAVAHTGTSKHHRPTPVHDSHLALRASRRRFPLRASRRRHSWQASGP